MMAMKERGQSKPLILITIQHNTHKPMNKQEIIDWERQNRNSTNRGTKSYGCIYSPTESSPGCAVGRLIADKVLCDQLDEEGYKGINTSIRCVFDKLPLEIQDLGKRFLAELQRWHDNELNFTETGLSEQGRTRLDEIEGKYITG